MAPPGKLRTVATTLTIALTSGYLVQNGDALAVRFMGEGDSSPSQIELTSTPLFQNDIFSNSAAGRSIKLPTPPASALISSPDPAKTRLIAPEVEVIRESGNHFIGAKSKSAFGLACDKDLKVADVGAGVVHLSLSAPCNGNQRVEIEHAGMRFAQRTSGTGELDLTIPVLLQNSVLSLTFEDGSSAEAMVDVEKVDSMDRVVMIWGGDTSLNIHALEFGANRGEEGHVWSGAPRSHNSALSARGGFITRLGDPHIENPMLAEIYSFPTRAISAQGTIQLSVETEVTPYNCGDTIVAKSAQRHAGEAELKWMELRFNMPGCDMIGQKLVLNNVVDDVMIAQN